MTIRSATAADVDLLLQLVERLDSELPPLPQQEDSAETERAKVEKMVRQGVALIAEEEGGEVVAFLLARYGDHGPTTVYVTDLWVDAERRGRGFGRELLRRAAETAANHGGSHLYLDVHSKNADALAFYFRLGFKEAAKILVAPLDVLSTPVVAAESFGAVYVQTDDADAVQRAVTQYLPRLARGTEAAVERDRGWTAVRPTPFDPDVARRIAREFSERFGIALLLAVEREAVVRFVLHDRGRMVDEYLSVPEFYGALPPGDALALRANPTVVARLTGADPARVRAVAQTAKSTAELPPPGELYRQLADVLGVVP